METFTIPGVGGIIERQVMGVDQILVQKRCKDDHLCEYGLIEIPAGKIRAYENIFDCLRREIYEETGLKVQKIWGEDESVIVEDNGYKVLSYKPFACSQNTAGHYPIMVQVFLCTVTGDCVESSNESKHIKWRDVASVQEELERAQSHFYPMHIHTLRAYFAFKAQEKNEN